MKTADVRSCPAGFLLMRKHFPPAHGSLGCWRHEVPKRTSEGKGNPPFHGTAARLLNDPWMHLAIAPTATLLPLPGPFHFSGYFPWETLSLHILRNSVCVLIKSSGQQPIAHRPNPDQIWSMTYFCVACDFKMELSLFLKVCERRKNM